jgi:hypothetical protein
VITYSKGNAEIKTNSVLQGLLTIGVAVANIAASKVPSLQSKPVTMILLGVDALFILFWLAAMGANAHLLSILNVPVTCVAYVDNGKPINSNTCITKRTNALLVVNGTGKGIIGAVIAFSLLEMYVSQPSDWNFREHANKWTGFYSQQS